MNASNTTRNSSSGPAARAPGLLFNSSFSSGNNATRSNYATNIIIGNNLSSQAPAGSFMLPGPTSTSFASEASASRKAMESGIGAVKMQETSMPINNVASGLRTATGLASAGMMASGVGAPVALAMQLSQAVGSAVHSGLNTSTQNKIGQDFIHNQQQWAIGGSKAAESVQASQQQRLAAANTGASIGSIFGPLGALAGWYIGSSTGPSSKDSYQVGSFKGSVSASDSGASRAVSSDALTGQTTMQDSTEI